MGVSMRKTGILGPTLLLPLLLLWSSIAGQGQNARSAPTNVRLQEYSITITGRVQTESGPFPEFVGVAFWKNGQILQSVFTNKEGHFSFRFGDEKAQTLDAEMSSARARSLGRSGNYVRTLVGGGEIRISVPGYHPINELYRGSLEFIGANKAGLITLRRITGVEGNSISATSFKAPPKARKEYFKASKLMQRKKLAPAESSLLKALKIYPQYAAAWNQLGRIYMGRNQPEKALEAFSEAVKIDPKYTAPYLGRLQIEIATGKYAPALQTSDTLLGLDPTNGSAHFYKALSHYSLGQHEEATTSAQAAVDSPHKPPVMAHFLLGTLFGNRGDHPKAIQHLRLYLIADHTSARAKQARTLLAEMGAPAPAPREQKVRGKNKGSGGT